VKTTRAFAAVALAALVAACGAAPGSNNAAKKKNAQPTATATSAPDIAKAGPVTLTVWDQKVRSGQNAQMKRLNAAFQQKYPNVKIDPSIADFNTHFQKLTVSAAAGDMPCLPQMQSTGLQAYADPKIVDLVQETLEKE